MHSLKHNTMYSKKIHNKMRNGLNSQIILKHLSTNILWLTSGSKRKLAMQKFLDLLDHAHSDSNNKNAVKTTIVLDACAWYSMHVVLLRIKENITERDNLLKVVSMGNKTTTYSGVSKICRTE